MKLQLNVSPCHWFLFCIILTIPMGCQTPSSDESQEAEWIELFNGQNLEGWKTYLGQAHVSIDSTRFPNGQDYHTMPFGIDNDPLEVVSIVETDEEQLIRISGEVFGMIYREEEYENYHLQLKMKWGDARFAPRANQKRDSGLLYHGFGEPGGVYTWMNSQELQIQETDLGDYWPVGDVEIDIPSRPMDSIYYIYDADSENRTYYFADILNTAQHDSMSKRRCFKHPDNENPHGEWNVVELYCLEDQSVYVINGKVVMRLFNSRSVESGTPQNLSKGRIGIQSEGAEVFYKDIRLRPIDKIPSTLL